MIRIGVISLLWGLVAAPCMAQSCEEPSLRGDLTDAVQATEQAWQDMNDGALTEAVTRMEQALTCMSEPVSPPDVAAYFRAQALGDFLIGDIEHATLALWTAKKIQPAYRFPAEIAGMDHPLVRLYETVAYRPSVAPITLFPPDSGAFFINGSTDMNPTEVPGGRPYVFQRVDTSGRVLQTVEVEPDQRPSYPARVIARQQLVTPTTPVSMSEPVALRRTSRGLLVGSVATGVGSVAMLAAAGSLRFRYNNAEVDEGSLDGLVPTNRALGWSGVGLGASSIGLGLGAVVVKRW